jgi:outer membrane protein assembly factor BamB
VYRQAEIGYDDVPESGGGRTRTGKLAVRLIIALVVGAAAGLAIMLQVKGWGTLISETGGSCGTSDQGVSYGACPRGIAPALVTSFLIGLPAVPAALVLVFRKGWARRGFLAVGIAGGLFAGQSLFAVWHGADLTVAWVAPGDSSPELTTVGAWTSGQSLIRVRVDEAVSYDAATGRRQWALTMPGIDVACGVSGTSSDTTLGLIEYGQDSTDCGNVMAVDLRTGRRLWSDPVKDPYTGNEPTGDLAVASGAAIVLTDDGIAGVNGQDGVQKWTLAPPAECSFQQLAASGGSVVAIADCNSAYYVVSLDAATGKAAWRYHVTEPANSYQYQILSTSPVVVSDALSGPRGTSKVRVFGADGTVTSSFSVSGIPLRGGTVALDTGSTDGFGVTAVVTGGMLVGLTDGFGGTTAFVGYRLADGKRLWLTATPDEVHDLTLSGGHLVFVDESDPAYSLEEADLATGAVRSLGYFSQAILQTEQSGLFASGGNYLIVNQSSDSSGEPPVAAITVPATPG